MTATALREALLQQGYALGFSRIGIATVEALPRREYFDAWLAEGRAGDMRFLEHHKKARLDPRTRFPWARSVISATLPYAAPAPADFDWRSEMRGRIAAYALGRDYHLVISERVDRWVEQMRGLQPGTEARAYVDTGAVFEHEWAQRSGVGWTGKHTLTLSREGGSWNFLCEVFTSLELPPDPPATDHCGTCTRCIDICPTGAIRSARDLDPRLCISYLTIEHKGTIPRPLRAAMGEWLFGCDLCQEPCPWNAGGSNPQEDLHPRLDELLRLDEVGFQRRFARTPLERTGLERLQRNATVVAGNTRNPAVLPSLDMARSSPSPLVRAHAAWAISRLDGNAVERRRVLEKLRRDPEAIVAAEAEDALAEVP